MKMTLQRTIKLRPIRQYRKTGFRFDCDSLYDTFSVRIYVKSTRIEQVVFPVCLGNRLKRSGMARHSLFTLASTVPLTLCWDSIRHRPEINSSEDNVSRQAFVYKARHCTRLMAFKFFGFFFEHSNSRLPTNKRCLRHNAYAIILLCTTCLLIAPPPILPQSYGILLTHHRSRLSETRVV